MMKKQDRLEMIKQAYESGQAIPHAVVKENKADEEANRKAREAETLAKSEAQDKATLAKSVKLVKAAEEIKASFVKALCLGEAYRAAATAYAAMLAECRKYVRGFGHDALEAFFRVYLLPILTAKYHDKSHYPDAESKSGNTTRAQNNINVAKSTFMRLGRKVTGNAGSRVPYAELAKAGNDKKKTETYEKVVSGLVKMFNVLNITSKQAQSEYLCAFVKNNQ